MLVKPNRQNHPRSPLQSSPSISINVTLSDPTTRRDEFPEELCETIHSRPRMGNGAQSRLDEGL